MNRNDRLLDISRDIINLRIEMRRLSDTLEKFEKKQAGISELKAAIKAVLDQDEGDSK